MQPILFMVLMGALGAAVAGLAALGLLQHLRRGALERWAHESGLHFSAEDTFDVPRRCAVFAICSAGHSAQASNITYGRLRGVPVRAFDFRYEVGHGTRRSTRHYSVVLVEAPAPPGVVLWNRLDAAQAPAAVQAADGMQGDWSWRGDAAQARRLGEACASLAGSGLSLEARPEGVMICFPMHRRGGRAARRGAYPVWLEAMGGLIESLGAAAAPGPRGQNGPAKAVENPPPPC
jgi:hypothetical protein